MAKLKKHQNIPNDWGKREKLRDKGQFWTPSWVAKAMISYVIKSSDFIFDPAAGNGAFYEALKMVNNKRKIKFYGIDVDETVLKKDVYTDGDCYLEKRDFIHNPPNRLFKSIVANPPYIRHHRLTHDIKDKLRQISKSILGFQIDGRAGFHIYFLITALKLLDDNGRLAFIMPADTCEGVFADDLWKWITKNYLLEAVITFKPDATPFPDVDTNAIVFLIKRAEPKPYFWWLISKESHTTDLTEFVASNFRLKNYRTLDIIERNLFEALGTGMSRNPSYVNFKYRLCDFAKVMRGIATGANEFFFLTREQVRKYNIPEEFIKIAVGRTRDVVNSSLTIETIKDLESKNRPTLLFSPDGRDFHNFPESVQRYLKLGEDLEINNRTLIKTRSPWYKMENRRIPPILFAYLGRRNLRFIKNEIGAIPLTGFLCVYPLMEERYFIDKLWKILNHPLTLANLPLVAKSYGSGALKVEPRCLEKLPIPNELISEFTIELPQNISEKQICLF